LHSGDIDLTELVVNGQLWGCTDAHRDLTDLVEVDCIVHSGVSNSRAQCLHGVLSDFLGGLEGLADANTVVWSIAQREESRSGGLVQLRFECL